MGKLIYSMLISLDGYVEDEHSRLGWGAPEDEEVHSCINALASSPGTYLYAHTIPDQPQFVLDWARQWKAAEKTVYSRTLAEPRSARVRLEREFNPDAVRRLKAEAEHDISVDGPELAAQAIRAGLVDEFQMIVCSVVVGEGKRFFPDGVRLDLELLEERRFFSGVVILRYGVRWAAGGLALGVKSSEILPA
jgi:dihydrofolate reductase